MARAAANCALFVALFTPGCVQRPDAKLILPPHLIPEPSTIDFGSVDVGSTAERSISLSNPGAWELPITGLELETRTFQITDLPTIIPAEGRSTATVRFTPRAAQREVAEGRILADGKVAYFYLDLDLGASIALSGEGTRTGPPAPLSVVPNPVRFGSVRTDCLGAFRSLRVINGTASSASITSADIDGGSASGFHLLGSRPPIQVPAYAIATLDLEFTPTAEGSSSAELVLDGRLGADQFEIPVGLLGEGVRGQRVEDGVDIGPVTVRDVLFIVDDSCSMEQEQMQLSMNFSAFIGLAEAAGIDYRIGVTTTDGGDGAPAEVGRLVPLAGPLRERVVTPDSTPSPEVVFRRNAAVGIDTTTQTEQGLKSALLALTEPLISTHNLGLLRPDVPLAIIVVSDENDQAPEPIEDYIQLFRDVVPDPNLLVFSAIIGDPPFGCLGPAGGAIGGDRYAQMAEATGGTFESICTEDWITTLGAIALSTFRTPARVVLTGRPEPGSLEVLLDGRPQPELGPNPWHYDPQTNIVAFRDSNIPGSRMTVSYVVACD